MLVKFDYKMYIFRSNVERKKKLLIGHIVKRPGMLVLIVKGIRERMNYVKKRLFHYIK